MAADDDFAPTEEADYFSRRRAVAWVVDTVVVTGATAAAASAVFGLTSADEGNVWDWMGTTRGVGLTLLVGFLYFALVPRRSGRSLGKLVAGLRVIRSGGGPPGRARLVARALLDMVTVGVFVFGALTFVPQEDGPSIKRIAFGALITLWFFFAWVVRDWLLDIQLSERR